MQKKTELRASARRLATGIREVLLAQGSESFVPEKRLVVEIAEETDGWCVQLGDLNVPGIRGVTIQLDRLPGDGRYHFWAGFFCLGTVRTDHLGKHLARHIAKPKRYSDKHLKFDGSLTSYAKALSSTDFRVPIVEVFENGTKTIGMYLGPHTKSGPSQSQILIASRFLAQCFTAIDSWHFRLRGESKPLLVREGIVKATAFKRSAAQALDAKIRDKFTCQICGVRPEAIYGADGKSCLEAHHVQALHTRKLKYSRLASLITVCANCHRVLGRLHPNERGLADLRNRFGQYRSAGNGRR